MKKILAITLALFMLLAIFASCTDKKNEPTDIPSDTPPIETPPADTEDNSLITIFEKGVNTEYKIIISDDYVDNQVMYSAVSTLEYYISDRFDFKYKLQITYDYQKYDPQIGEYEILIGNPRRTETQEAKKLLTGAQNEYAIKFFENGKIAIVGSNFESLKEGVYYFQNNYILNSTDDVLKLKGGFSYVHKLADTSTGANWMLAAPQYQGGTLASDFYDIGPGIALQSSTGLMQIVSNTNASEFNAYVETLKSAGYTQDIRTERNGNIYVSLTNKNGKLFYTYYTKAFNEVRIIEDYITVPESSFEYTYTAKSGETTTYYQYGMMRNPTGDGNNVGDPSKTLINAGAFDIIKLADNKLIIIDGGGESQATAKATEELIKFLREITNTPDNEKIVIAAWYLTHPHGDHYEFINQIANNHIDEFKFERIMHNVAISGISGVGGVLSKFSQKIIQNNPGIKFMKLHTGQNITLGNINFDVIMTHEDAVNPTNGRTYIVDQNNASAVLKFNINGKSIMYFGDWGGNDQSTKEKEKEYQEMEKRLLLPYAENGSYPFLKCDIVQIAHHAINDWLTNVYKVIDADYAFFCQQDIAYDQMAHVCYKNIVNQLRDTGMTDDNMFFGGRKTHWMTIAQDGTMTHGSEQLRGADDSYWTLLANYKAWNT